MEQLFDSLSEDWVSQPRSPLSGQAQRSSPVAYSISHLSNGSQSRIPRFQARTASRPSSERSDGQPRKSSAPVRGAKKLPLGEKSTSTLNTFNGTPRSNGSVKRDEVSPWSIKGSKPRPPKDSLRHVPQDTVQHKPSEPSPLKAQARKETPEWKRRLKNKTGSGDQQDLFSPIGLESVFKPPTIKPTSAKKNDPRYVPLAKTDVSSRPPSMSAEAEAGGIEKSSQRGPESSEIRSAKHLDALQEDPQIISGEYTPEESNFGPDQTRPTRSRRVNHASSDRVKSGTKRPQVTPKLPSYHHKNRQTSQKQREDPDLHRANTGSDDYDLLERSWVTSGQTADLNEDLSPFFISRQHTVDGRVAYAPVVNTDDARKRMSDLYLQQHDRPSSRLSDHAISYLPPHSPPLSPDVPVPASDITSHSLPEDLSTGTQSFVAKGGFVNPRRGGRSREGSFLKRPLSPTSPPSSGSRQVVPQEQTLHNAQHKIDKELNPPTTPRRVRDDEPTSSGRPGSSGSPLKLFDKYDTFTNDRLQRRLSKFEEVVPDSAEEASSFERVNQDDLQGHGIHKTKLDAFGTSKVSGSRVTSFGEGELDYHTFESFSSPPSRKAMRPTSDDENNVQSTKQNGERFRFVRSDYFESNSEAAFPRMQGPKPGPHLAGSEEDKIIEPEMFDTKDDNHVAHTVNGKRLPYSPVKDPKPKRRRTLRSPEESELDALRARQDSISTGHPSSSLLGRKRKDALYDGSAQAADPKVLAMRQILRPRNPTPSQSASYIKDVRKGKAEANGPSSQQYSNRTSARNHDGKDPDALTEKLAEELATLAQDIAEKIPGSVRKPSMNTADFQYEAQHVMQLIRSRGRPVNEVIDEENTAESEDEHQSHYAESTREEFIRPPSREGGSLRKPREPRQLDARVVSHLRKFEEKTDAGLTLSSSLKSLKLGQQNDTAVTIELKEIATRQDNDIESDSNVRIIDRKRRHSSSATTALVLSNGTQPHLVESQSSSEPSTGQSLPTNSSRSSRNRAVIALETVAHLLSDQVAGMTFDHVRQVWVKSRSSSKADGKDELVGVDDESTEDELGGIPDLSVDEIEELRRIKKTEYSLELKAFVSNQVSAHDHAQLNTSDAYAPTEKSSRPQTADGTQTNPPDTSSAPSKFSRFTASGPVPETRATSWGDEAFSRKGQEPSPINHPQDEQIEDVEHEISILEGRQTRNPGHSTYRQPRVVTVAFSSPLVDQVEVSYYRDGEPDSEEDLGELHLDESPVRKISASRSLSTARRVSSGSTRQTAYRCASRRLSVGPQSYIARPLSRLDEQDELSMIHVPNGGALDLAISTPLPASNQSLIIPPTGKTSSSATFQLSPLPDFSVHQIDRPLDRAQPLVLCSSTNHERQVSQATQEIVKKITDVEPYEPYWEYLRALDMHESNIASLHMLNEFCGRLEELNVSNNQLRELTGVPFTLRHLKIRNNCLSNLTAWNHLYNLQYLDLSGNQLQNIRSLQSLLHLREIKANDNQIEDIHGILELDGLIRLSLRRNRVERVDFEACNL